MSNCYHPPMATTTVRLPLELKTEADAFASSLGISLNALMAVALRDYINARPDTLRFVASAPSPTAASSVVPPPPPAVPQSAPIPVARTFRPPKSRADPCPCGATDLHGRPIRWKHCHGAVK